MKNNFFKKKINIKINDILLAINFKKQKINYKVKDIKELETALKDDISFFHSIKYKELIKKTKSKIIITNKKFKNIIPKEINIIEVNNVLLTVAKITSLFYPTALNDNFDGEVNYANKNDYPGLIFGKNVLLEKMLVFVKIVLLDIIQ